jgi:photosystem II stability/assembly factor-like uncharacterized protein
LALAAALAMLGFSTAGPQAAEPSPLFAAPARLAAHSLLIAIASAGPRLVAVGDRGIIVLSDDRGASWVQAASVPSQVLLTGVCFLDAQHGVAVGHDEVILVSADAGRSWTLTHYAPQALRPLLDVWCGAGGHVIAVGAYSAYFTSTDGGTTWNEGKFTPAAAAPPKGALAPHGHNGAGASAAAGDGAGSAADAAGEQAGGGFHLNRIVSAGGSRLYIAGEAGHLYRSDDEGTSWRTLPSPYEGSFFGMLPLQGDAVLAFGLRGNLFRSTDAGSSWQKINTGTVAMLTGATHFDAGAIAIVGLSGVVLVSRDGGRNFTLLQQADRAGLSAAVAAPDERLATVGENGAKLIGLSRSAVGGGAGAAP